MINWVIAICFAADQLLCRKLEQKIPICSDKPWRGRQGLAEASAAGTPSPPRRAAHPWGQGGERGSPVYLMRNSWESSCDAFALSSQPDQIPSSCSQPCFTAELLDLFPTVHSGDSPAQGGGAGTEHLGSFVWSGPATVCMKPYPKLILCPVLGLIWAGLYTPLCVEVLCTQCSEVWSRRCLLWSDLSNIRKIF